MPASLYFIEKWTNDHKFEKKYNNFSNTDCISVIKKNCVFLITLCIHFIADSIVKTQTL